MSISIRSSSQFEKILSSSKIVVADFYADWCGPCNAIAPTFESLATKYSKPNRITFVKVNVDNYQEISQRYGVRALPTFIIFRSGSILNTIRGADQSSLRSGIESVIRLAGPEGPIYSSEGRTLGSTNSQRTHLSRPFDLKGFINTIVSFFVLYFTTLFSLDAYSAGENSPFNINRTPVSSTSSASIQRATGGGKKLGTIADL
ncbi:Thioredoxin [Erysiphe neolycopersici]|uniref:Thioredoxin n=1 Tax=Erysiphe neolycopersici TaxID=212602 RepID=A0A420HZ12_9PEZI|nr:Thioredoxin [Erysiphe neolycopersici]